MELNQSSFKISPKKTKTGLTKTRVSHSPALATSTTKKKKRPNTAAKKLKTARSPPKEKLVTFAELRKMQKEEEMAYMGPGAHDTGDDFGT